MSSRDNLGEYGVFVSDIARGVTDEMLKEEFLKIADVAEAIVVKNKHSGETKGYGFVKFFSMTDCYRAVEWTSPPTFKDLISGKSQSVKVTMADTKNTLYIGLIPKDLNEREVKMELEDISGCTVKSFEFDGPSSSSGWAYFKDHDTTIKAIKLIQKSKYTASLTKKSASTAASGLPSSGIEIPPSTKVLFARGIKTQDEGDQLMKQLGSDFVEKVVVPLDMQKKVPLGHAFIYCHTIDDAKDVMDKYAEGIEFMGRTVILAWGQPKHKHRFVDPYAAFDYSYMLYPPEYLYPPPPYGAPRGGRPSYHHPAEGSHHYPSSGGSSSSRDSKHHRDSHHHHHHSSPPPHHPYPYMMPPIKGAYEIPYPPPYYPHSERGSAPPSRGGRPPAYSRYTPY